MYAYIHLSTSRPPPPPEKTPQNIDDKLSKEEMLAILTDLYTREAEVQKDITTAQQDEENINKEIQARVARAPNAASSIRERQTAERISPLPPKPASGNGASSSTAAPEASGPQTRVARLEESLEKLNETMNRKLALVTDLLGTLQEATLISAEVRSLLSQTLSNLGVQVEDRFAHHLLHGTLTV